MTLPHTRCLFFFSCVIRRAQFYPHRIRKHALTNRTEPSDRHTHTPKIAMKIVKLTILTLSLVRSQIIPFVQRSAVVFTVLVIIVVGLSEHIISISKANAIIIRLIIAILEKSIIKTAFSRATTHSFFFGWLVDSNTRTNWCRVIGKSDKRNKKVEILISLNFWLKAKQNRNGSIARRQKEKPNQLNATQTRKTKSQRKKKKKCAHFCFLFLIRCILHNLPFNNFVIRCLW